MCASQAERNVAWSAGGRRGNEPPSSTAAT